RHETEFRRQAFPNRSWGSRSNLAGAHEGQGTKDLLCRCLGLAGSCCGAIFAGWSRLAGALPQASGFADALPQVIKLGPADTAGAVHLDFGNFGRVQREDAFDAFTLNDAANGEHLAHAAASAGDDRAGVNLDAFLLAFQNSKVDFDLVPDLE